MEYVQYEQSNASIPRWVMSLTQSNGLAVTSLVLGILAFLSNGAFLFTVFKQSSLRKMRLNFYLIPLSFIDMYTSIIYIVMGGLYLYLIDTDLDSLGGFALSLIIRFPAQFVSCTLIMLMSWDRYKVVSDPINQSIRHTTCPKIRLLVMILIATAAFALLLVTAFLFLDFFFFIIFLYDFVTIVGTGILNLKIIIVLRKRHELHRGNVSNRNFARQQQQVTIAVIINSFVFVSLVFIFDAFFFLPFFGQEFYPYPLIICTLLNSGLNPVIYNIFGSIYREAFLNTFPCLKTIALWLMSFKINNEPGIELNTINEQP